jgi:chemotaxis protein MotA
MSKPQREKFDFTSLAGLLIAALGILGGLILEKGQLRDVSQITAAMIVLGGTFGAVIVSTPANLLLSALKRSRSVMWSNAQKPTEVLEELVRFSNAARRSGPASLEPEVAEIADPFIKKGMMLVVDGFHASEIRNVLELDLIVSEQEAETDAKVFEAAGGYAPTIGIIGAVLGLMQVMKHLDNISEVGRGIAVAFVATVYGVGLANLVLLPMAAKIRTRAQATSKIREMIVEGIIGIQEAKNPRLIRQILGPFAAEAAGKGERPEERKPRIALAQKAG